MFSQKKSKTSPWEKINIKKIHWSVRWCSDFEYILESQANFMQLINSGCNIICISLFAPERGMTTAKLLMDQAKGTLNEYLDPAELARINSDDMSPYKLVSEDITDVMLNPKQFNILDKKVIVLHKGVAYDPTDSSSVYVAFSVEGAHSLADTFDKQNMTAESILKNLDDLLVTKKMPIVSVNLTHLEKFKFCNHAFGILFVANEDFKPIDQDFSEEGIQLLRGCYERGLLVDIKHMSLGARRFLIEVLREQDDIKNISQPLVCTHAGFTGLSYKDIPDYITAYNEKKAGYAYVIWSKPKHYEGNEFTSFNPSSINLYNEDILAVLRSGGIIGLSLDKRILGVSEPNTMPDALNDFAFEEEYISLKEKKYFITKKKLGESVDDSHCITTQEVLEGGLVKPAAAYYHLCHFMSHILHLIKVANDDGYDAMKALTQVCIGSDFDGMINPIWCCESVESLPGFKKDFVKEFPLYAKANSDKVKLPATFDIHTFANQLFFENGKNFVLERIAK